MIRPMTRENICPAFSINGEFIQDGALAAAIIESVKEIPVGSLEHYRDFYVAMARSRSAFICHDLSKSPMLVNWSEMYCNTPMSATVAVQAYELTAALISLRLRYHGTLDKIYISGVGQDTLCTLRIIPAFKANIDTRTRHTLTSAKQVGWYVMALPEGETVEQIWFTEDCNTRYIGTSEADVKKFIAVANHLNSEPE